MKLLTRSYSTVHSLRLLIMGLMVSVGVMSCRNDQTIDVLDLTLPDTTYYVAEGGEMLVPILSGNNRYTFTVADTTHIQASYSATYTLAGSIYLKGLEKGTTQLKIKDELSGQEATVEVHVVDPFLVMQAGQVLGNVQGVHDTVSRNIRESLKDFSELKPGEILILQQSAARTYHVFKNQADLRSGSIDRSGTYALSFSYGGPHRLILQDAENGESHVFPLHITFSGVFSTLLEFARHESEDAEAMQAELSLRALVAQVPQNTSPTSQDHFYLFQDLTARFKTTYPSVQVVESFQEMYLVPPFRYVNIGKGILQ